MLNERRHKEYIFMIIYLNFRKCNSLTITYSERKWVRVAHGGEEELEKGITKEHEESFSLLHNNLLAFFIINCKKQN